MSLALFFPLLRPLTGLLNAYLLSISPQHGKVIFPASRASHLLRQGILDEHLANELEGGKGFPAILGHQLDPDAPDDEPSREPPWDGEIASGGRTEDNRKYLNYAYGEPVTDAGINLDTHWSTFHVDPNVQFKVEWHHAAKHKTRRWSYWLTQPGWDSSQRLKREHFGDAPIKIFPQSYRPFWDDPRASEELIPPTYLIHEFDLPERHGYHVLLAVWDVADTFSAFYQVIDLEFD